MDSSKYLVLDVETNGLKSETDDLLSITIYKPDTNEYFDRYLPLELNDRVVTGKINGITGRKLKGKKPLSQEELDEIYKNFEFASRTILVYGSLDQRFIRKYLQRHNLSGIEKWHFFNFKRNIISSRFSGGIYTKDNLCKLFDIKGVKEVHTGKNDCLLEWKLFEAMDEKPLLCISGDVYWFNQNYVVPASYLANYKNFIYHINVPKIKVNAKIIKTFEITSEEKIQKFPTNFNGIMVEAVITAMLGAEKQNNRKKLSNNLKQLKYIGTIGSAFEEVPIYVENDGTITFIRPKDQPLSARVNLQIAAFKELFKEMIEYLKKEIFKDELIMSQELIIDRKANVLALCDLSSKNAVVEIKTNNWDDWNKYAIQMFIQSSGRPVYCLTTEWKGRSSNSLKFHLHKIEFEDQELLRKNAKEDYWEKMREKYQTILNNKTLKIIAYKGSAQGMDIQCTLCGNIFSRRPLSIKNNPSTTCPACRGIMRSKGMNNKKNYQKKSVESYMALPYKKRMIKQ